MTSKLTLTLALAVGASAFAPAAARSSAFSRRTPLAMAASFYDLKDTDSSGAEIDFAQFKAFHGAFYHPANARVFFYGDDDPAARLALASHSYCR